METDSDFGFYGNDEEESSRGVKDIRGITDTVSPYAYTNVEMPSIVIKQGIKIPRHKLLVVANMVKSSVPGKDITVYVVKSDGMFKMGKISGMQVIPFVDMLGIENLTGQSRKGTVLQDDLLLTLSS